LLSISCILRYLPRYRVGLEVVPVANTQSREVNLTKRVQTPLGTPVLPQSFWVQTAESVDRGDSSFSSRRNPVNLSGS